MPDNDSAQRELDKLKKDLELTQNQLTLLFQITSLANEGKDLSYFHSRCLELIAKHYNFSIAQVWDANEAEQVIVCGAPWYSAGSYVEFRQASRERRLSKGIGLPGRTWGTGSATLIEDISKETRVAFPRAASATSASLVGALAFPVRRGQDIIGVYEFFSTEPLPKDEQTLPFLEKLGSYLGVFISEKSSIETLYESDLINRIILDKAYNGFVAIDARGVITTWTRRSEEIFGWRREEVVGKALADVLIPQRYRDAHVHGMFRFLGTGETRVSNKRVRTPALHKQGHEVSIEMVIFPIVLQDKTLFGAYLVDLSQQPEPPDIVLQ